MARTRRGVSASMSTKSAAKAEPRIQPSAQPSQNGMNDTAVTMAPKMKVPIMSTGM